MKNENILKIIENLNIKRNVSFKLSQNTRPEYFIEYFGLVSLDNNKNINLSISFKKNFPLTLPDIYIENISRYYAHTSVNGKICLFDTSSLIIKQDMADEILIECFDQAVRILNIDPSSLEYNDEICREFNSYWLSVATKKNFY